MGGISRAAYARGRTRGRAAFVEMPAEKRLAWSHLPPNPRWRVLVTAIEGVEMVAMVLASAWHGTGLAAPYGDFLTPRGRRGEPRWFLKRHHDNTCIVSEHVRP